MDYLASGPGSKGTVRLSCVAEAGTAEGGRGTDEENAAQQLIEDMPKGFQRGKRKTSAEGYVDIPRGRKGEMDMTEEQVRSEEG